MQHSNYWYQELYHEWFWKMCDSNWWEGSITLISNRKFHVACSHVVLSFTIMLNVCWCKTMVDQMLQNSTKQFYAFNEKIILIQRILYIFKEIIIYSTNYLYIQRNNYLHIQWNNYIFNEIIIYSTNYLYTQRINYLYIQRNNCLYI